MKISKLVDNVNCIPVEIESMDALAQVITMTNWAPGIFANNYRNLANFTATDVIALDIDEGCTLEEARKHFADYEHAIATTRSHQKEKNGVVCDRFRVILRLEKPITSSRTYTSTYLALGISAPYVDLACADAARQFYQSVEIVSVNNKGRTVEVVEKGAVGKSTIEFLNNGSEKNWNINLFKAARDLHQQGYDQEQTTALLKRPTGYLDSKDLSTIASAFKTEPKHPARVEPRLPVNNEDERPTAEGWVGQWIISRGLTINYNEQIVVDGIPMNYSQIEDRLLLDTAKTGYKFGKDLLYAALRVYYDSAVLNIVEETRRLLLYQPTSENLVGEFVRALTGRDDELTEIVMRHFIWSVKRKLNGLKVVYHMMPILVGKSGGGKTEAIKRFIKPLFTLSTFKNLNIVNDERQNFNFSKYFIVFFDEMSRADKTDVECLKNIITSDVISYRMMGKNKNSNGHNVSTLIGASNNPIKNIINDPTSTRRYFQVNCQNVIDRNVVNGLDYLAMWRSIDENSPAPVIPFLDILAPVQEESRQISIVEEWLQMECDLTVDHWMKGRDVVREFTEWIKEHNLKASYRPQRLLEELKGHVEKKRIDGVTRYKIQIKTLLGT